MRPASLAARKGRGKPRYQKPRTAGRPAPDEHLRSHVGGRAHGAAIPGQLGHGRGQAEVGDACVAAAVDHHVGGLQVAVQDPALVGGGQAGGDLAGDLHRAVAGQAADAGEQRGQVLAVHQLHRDEGVALALADVVDAHHPRMGDLPRGADLAREALQAGRVLLEGLGQELQGDRLADAQVVGAVDLAHGARAQQTHDAVAPLQHHPREEGAVVDRGHGGWPDRSRAEPPARFRSRRPSPTSRDS